MQKKLLFFLYLLIFISCESVKNNSFEDLFSQKEKIHLLEFPGYLTDSLKSPDMILSIGDYLILSEPQLPYLLSCYNLKTNAFKRFLPKGQGQNEAINVQSLGVAYDSYHFYAQDIISQSTFLFSSKDSCSSLEKDSTDFSGKICSIAYDSLMTFYLKINSENRFSLSFNNNITDFGNNVSIEGLSPVLVSHVLQGPCILSSVQKKIAWFSVYGDVMEIYDYSDRENIKLVKSEVVCLPVFDKTAGLNTGVMDKSTKLSVSSVTSDDRYLYALYNENLLSDVATLKDDIFYSNKILVFDWYGNAYKVIELDKKIRSISYCKAKNALLCLGLNEDLDARIYNLPLSTIN